MTTKSSQLPIQPADFERIFRTIHGVLLVENIDTTRACVLFNNIGAMILRFHYKLEARPVAGFAAYKLDESDDGVLTFATKENGALFTDYDAFHCWVQCDDWFLDFTSPLFHEICISEGSKKMHERKMFQKQKAGMSMVNSPLQERGSFVYDENPNLTKKITRDFYSTPLQLDLMKICVEWYQHPPKEMPEVQRIWDAAGQVKEAKLSPLTLTGAW